jgi:predicted ATPase
MLIFEDLHWVDNETQALLNLFIEGVANAPVLLLVNYRPEYTHEWGSKTYYTQLRLDPLGKESAEEMLSMLVGDSAEVGPLKQLVLERTEETRCSWRNSSRRCSNRACWSGTARCA